MFEISVENIIVTLGYIGIFGLMISNGVITLPSSQLLYIITGYFIFTGELNLALVSLIGALGNTIGNIILYELARRKGLGYITAFKIFPLREIKKIQVVFEKRGALFVFFGKLLPAIKVFVPIVAGIGLMNRAVYIPIIFITSLLWSFIFIGIGFFFGKNTDLFGIYPVILIVVVLVVVFAFYKYMNSQSIVSEVEKLDSNNKT